ncbi:AsmA family protein [Henriciella sp. AS95]|uniref:AsmA family protein n=1 Tax=Henriciella sp. AS95 TaxID=3135782 RepID=UPI0031801153
MKRLFIIGGAVISLLIVALLVIPFLVPDSVYKAQIEKSAASALGRDVQVLGDVSISVFPGISASVEDVEVANPDGFAEPNMITAGALRGSVRLLPLLSRRVEINKIEFVDADVTLTKLEDGRVNWMLGPDDEGDAPRPDKDSAGGSSPSIAKISLQNASIVYEDLSQGSRYELTELDAETALRSLEAPLVVKASGKFQQQSFSTDLILTTPKSLQATEQANIKFDLNSDFGFVSYSGDVVTGDAMSVSGAFSASLPQLSAISDFFGLDLPINMQPLGALEVDGNVSGPLTALSFEFEKLALIGDGLNASYSGGMILGADPLLDGRSTITVRNVSNLVKNLGLNLPQLEPLHQLNFSSELTGALMSPALTGAEIRTNSPTLQASFAGDMSLAGMGNVDGDFKLESNQLRTLMSQIGASLPEGDQLKVLRVDGRAKGTFADLAISDGSFQLDDVRASGSVGADLSRSVPTIKVDLSTDDIDLSPFLGSGTSSPEETPAGWSDEPLDLQGLKLINAEIDLEAESIKFGGITISDSLLSATLSDGVLKSDFERFNAFGGDWSGLINVDASRSLPQFGFNLDSKGVSAQSLLGTLAGFDGMSGNGAFSVNVTSNGTTINQIVNQLRGAASLDVADGALKGINLGQLVRSASSLTEQLASGNLTLANLGQVVSPQAATDFTDFESELAISGGVASIQKLVLANNVLNVSGAGQINLGGRSLDIKLTPAIDRTAQGEASTVQLNGIPVPLRVSGNWLTPQFSPDFSGVRAALQQKVRDRATDAIAGQIDGDIGSIIAGALGGDQSSNKSGEAENSEPLETAEEAEEGTDVESREQLIENALGSIFGPN